MIIISADNKYEYIGTKLSGFESRYIYIPFSIISDTELDIKKVGVFSYLKINCGLNDIISFSIPNMVTWCGLKPDRKIGRINDKFLDILDNLNDMGYLTYLTKSSKSSYMMCEFDSKFYGEECSNNYAVMYLDEIEKIMKYKKENSNDNILTNTTILLVFAYLRYKIKRRKNELKPEECSPEGIKSRQERCPEAYDGNISDIADELGISEKTLSKIIDILEYDLELIVTDRAYRVRNKDGEFRTLPTIFANAYKRDGKYLLASGEEYSRTEIELKANNMKQYYQDYKIDKNKRKKK